MPAEIDEFATLGRRRSSLHPVVVIVAFALVTGVVAGGADALFSAHGVPRARPTKLTVEQVGSRGTLGLPTRTVAVASKALGLVSAPVVPTGDASCASSTNCVAPALEGSAPAVLVTKDGGRSWASSLVVPSAAPTATGAGPVSCPDPSHCYLVVTDSGHSKLFASADGGTSWHASALPGALGYVRALSCPSAQSCLAAGSATDEATSAPAIASTTNGGRAWRSEPVPAQMVVIDALDCSEVASCVLGGQLATAPGVRGDITDGALLDSSDFGASWSVASRTAAVPSALTCVGQSTCLAAGDEEGPDRGDSAGRTTVAYISTDSGRRWKSRPIPSLSLVSQASAGSPVLACTSSSDCLLVLRPSTVLATADGGVSWRAFPAARAGGGADGAACSPAGREGLCLVISSGAPGHIAVGPGAEVRAAGNGSATAGLSEASLPAAASRLQVACSSSTTCAVAGIGSSYAAVVRTPSRPGGLATYSRLGLEALTHDAHPVVTSLSCGSYFCGAEVRAGPREVLVGEARGTARQYAVALPPGATTGATCDSVSFCVSAIGAPAAPRVEITTDGGHRWHKMPAPARLALAAAACSSPADCMAVVSDRAGEHLSVLETRDGGKAWAPVSSAVGGTFGFSRAGCDPSGTCFVEAVDGAATELAVSDRYGASFRTTRFTKTSVELVGVPTCSGSTCILPAVAGVAGGFLVTRSTGAWSFDELGADRTVGSAFSAGSDAVACSAPGTCVAVVLGRSGQVIYSVTGSRTT